MEPSVGLAEPLPRNFLFHHGNLDRRVYKEKLIEAFKEVWSASTKWTLRRGIKKFVVDIQSGRSCRSRR